jgi:hypothetical protein
MHIDWVNIVIALLSSVAGGLIGGWTVAFRMGQWRQMVEQTLAEHDKRLDAGDDPIEKVPVIASRLDTVIEEIRDIKKSLREDIRLLVSREECDRRHQT